MNLRWLVGPDNVGTLQALVGQTWEDVPVVRERHPKVDDTLTRREMGIAQGFTGDICVTCGQPTMKRNGPCLVCETCGSTTGCS